MIRPATIDDLQPVLHLAAAMAAESPRFRRLPFSYVRMAETLRNTLATEDGFWWVAEHGGAITGVMAGFVSEHWMSEARLAFDLALYVSRDARGGMDGRGLIRQFVAWAAARGAVWPQAGVTAGIDDEASVRLYESEGFKRCGYILEGPCAADLNS
jgi:GNAT superfamily N-acetyltransferase